MTYLYHYKIIVKKPIETVVWPRPVLPYLTKGGGGIPVGSPVLKLNNYPDLSSHVDSTPRWFNPRLPCNVACFYDFQFWKSKKVKLWRKRCLLRSCWAFISTALPAWESVTPQKLDVCIGYWEEKPILLYLQIGYGYPRRTKLSFGNFNKKL